MRRKTCKEEASCAPARVSYVLSARVMRGAGPRIPRKGLAPTFSHPTATLHFRGSDRPIESRAARVR